MPRKGVIDFKGSTSFNGSTSTIDLGSLPSITAATTGITAVIWAYIPRSTFGLDQTIFGNSGNNAVTGFSVRKYLNGQIFFYHAGINVSAQPQYGRWNL